MISHISIKNFATIENIDVDFEDGLNIITGETGSGKSIVIEAISLALGSRADSSYVRTGTDKAVIQLVGYLGDDAECKQWCDEQLAGNIRDTENRLFDRRKMGFAFDYTDCFMEGLCLLDDVLFSRT